MHITHSFSNTVNNVVSKTCGFRFITCFFLFFHFVFSRNKIIENNLNMQLVSMFDCHTFLNASQKEKKKCLCTFRGLFFTNLGSHWNGTKKSLRELYSKTIPVSTNLLELLEKNVLPLPDLVWRCSFSLRKTKKKIWSVLAFGSAALWQEHTVRQLLQQVFLIRGRKNFVWTEDKVEHCIVKPTHYRRILIGSHAIKISRISKVSSGAVPGQGDGNDFPQRDTVSKAQVTTKLKNMRTNVTSIKIGVIKNICMWVRLNIYA